MPASLSFRCLLFLLLIACAVPREASALQVGLRQIQLAGEGADAPAVTVALFYPTQAEDRVIPMGPYTLKVAINGPPEPTVRALILLSHGTGGSELAHSRLAEALARRGYLVAALRHPGDNWQDTSLLTQHGETFFNVRPQQAWRVITAVLDDPDWTDRIVRDAQGPRVGAVGHSAGGYTVLALAGGEPDLTRLAAHCASERELDPMFCRTGRTAQPPAPAGTSSTEATVPASNTVALIDRRVRAVVAMAPVGAVFSASSLAKIRIPVALYEAEADRWLVPRFHAEWIAQQLPGVHVHRVAGAWHLAFVDPPSYPIPTEDGDLGADPPGFDRAKFLDRLGQEIPDFFDAAIQ